MTKIAYIGDNQYFDLLDRHQDKPKDIELKFFNYALEIFDNSAIYKADFILIMVNHSDNDHKRSSYFGLTEVFPALRMFYKFDGYVVIIGFDSIVSLRKNFGVNFINNEEDVSDFYIQLPLTWTELYRKINNQKKLFSPKKYIKFLKKCGYLGNLKHKYSNSPEYRVENIIDFIEGRSDKLEFNLNEKYHNSQTKDETKSLPLVKLLVVDDANHFSSRLKEAFHKVLPIYEEKIGIQIEIISTRYSISINENRGVFNNRENFDFDDPGFLEEDGDIQIVLLDWQLEIPDHQGTETIYQKCIKGELIDRIKEFRPDIYTYTMTAFSTSAAEIVNMQQDVKSFFFKEEILQDPRSILDRILLKDLKEKMKAPFWEAYQNYIEKATDTWHPPGHCRGKGFFNSPYLKPFYKYWGREVFTGDLSFGVNDIGLLDESSDSIGEAQKVAADTFGADHTFFITNGTSTSNKVVMQSVLKPGDKVIIDRNCHKSNHYAFLLAGATPVFLETEYISQYSFFMPPSLSIIEKALNNNTDAKMLLLTGSNYEGIVIDTGSIVKKAKSIIPGIKVFIDEAWFAYGAFHPLMRRYSATFNMADYVTHSAHKVLSSFSQASLIHINDPDFKQNEDFFRDIYQAYLSTSPQYQIIASLDICSLQMRMEGFKILQNLIFLTKKLCSQIKSWKPSRIKVVDEDILKVIYTEWDENRLYKDTLKVLLDISELNCSTEDLCKFLNKEVGLEIERRTKNTILVIFSIGTDRSMVFRLLGALKKINDGIISLPSVKKVSISPKYPEKNKVIIFPRNAFYSTRVRIPIDQAEGAISASLVTPYPPGIPILVFGQLIEKENIEKLNELIDDLNTKNVHGTKIDENGVNCVYVVAVHENIKKVNYNFEYKFATINAKVDINKILKDSDKQSLSGDNKKLFALKIEK